MTPVFLDSRLFEVEPLCDTPAADHGFELRMARRILVLAWLYAGGPRYGLLEADLMPFVERASAYWRARGHALFDHRPATIVTVLFQLEALGAVASFAEAPGGFHVQLAEQQ